jgi:hypothetical protein
MKDARTVDTWDVLEGVVSPEVDHQPGVLRVRWSRQHWSRMLPGTVDDQDEDGPMAAAYERGLADGEAGLTYEVPPARDGRVRFTRCYRHGYEHGAAIRARSAAA